MTELLRPQRESAVPASLGWFAARNAAWGALFGVGISIAWMVISQDFWFAVHVALVSAALTAVYGAVCSVPAFLVGRAAAHLRLLVVGVTFAGTAMAIQVGLIMLVSAAWSFIWHAAAYSVLGAVTAVLTFRRSIRELPRKLPIGAAQ